MPEHRREPRRSLTLRIIGLGFTLAVGLLVWGTVIYLAIKAAIP